MGECQLRANQRTESHTVLRGINKCLPLLSIVIVQAEGKLRIRDLNTVLFNIRGFRQIGPGKIIHSLGAYMKLHLSVYCEACHI